MRFSLRAAAALLALLLILTGFASCSGGQPQEEPSSELPSTEAPFSEEPSTEEPATEEQTEPAEEYLEAGGVRIRLPEGWKVIDYNGLATAVPSNYPVDTDSISINFGNDNPVAYTEENFTSLLESYFGEGSISDFEIVRDTDQGVTRIVISYLVNNLFRQTLCTYFSGGDSVTVTLSDSSGNYAKELEDARASILLESWPPVPEASEPNYYTACGVRVTLPAGWQIIDNEGTQTAVPASYPNYTDSITITFGTGTTNLLSEDLVLMSLKTIFGEDSISEYQYAQDTDQGLDRVVYSYLISSQGVRQTVVSCFRDGRYVAVAFTNSSGEFADALEASRGTILVDGWTDEEPASSEPANDEPNVLAIEEIEITLPAGWQLMDVNGTKTAVAPTYPDPSDNIAFTFGTDDPNAMSEALLVAVIEAIYGQGSVSDFQLVRDMDQGATRVVVSYILLDTYRQTLCNYYYNGKSATVTFTDVSGRYTDVFETVRESIVLHLD
ncbi:MAG: hypothetical protein J5938_04825 [Clostridia bacterium]|nr:hypothetical protein [Clostridia bacterium]